MTRAVSRYAVARPSRDRSCPNGGPLIRKLTSTFGYRPGRAAVGRETFHVTMTPQAFQVRLNRANAETELLTADD